MFIISKSLEVFWFSRQIKLTLLIKMKIEAVITICELNAK